MATTRSRSSPRGGLPPGVVVRHSRTCASRRGEPCDGIGERNEFRCVYVAWAFDRKTHSKTWSPPFGRLEEARKWRARRVVDIKDGRLRAAPSRTLREAADELVAGMKAGTITSRKGTAYKPSVIREYERDLALLCEELRERTKLAQLDRAKIRRMVEQLIGRGLSGSRIRGILAPLRVIINRATEDGELAVSPLTGLRLPAANGRRERVADPEELAGLLDALPLVFETERGGRVPLRAVYGLAGYAGLRAGEIQALDRSDVDLARGVIHVRRSWDPKAREFVEPKSEAGARAMPIVGPLRDILSEHLAETKRETGLLLGDGERPFTLSTVHRAAAKAWQAENGRRAERELPPFVPIGLHELRHSAASMWIEAGRPAPVVAAWLGHSDPAFTYRQYVKVFRAHERLHLEAVDAYLAGADEAGRAEQVSW